MQPGKPSFAVEKWALCIEGTTEDPGSQLGLHGHGFFGLEPESLVGPLARNSERESQRKAPKGKGNHPGDGVQDIHQFVYAVALSNREDWPPNHLPIIELESLASPLL